MRSELFHRLKRTSIFYSIVSFHVRQAYTHTLKLKLTNTNNFESKSFRAPRIRSLCENMRQERTKQMKTKTKMKNIIYFK